MAEPIAVKLHRLKSLECVFHIVDQRLLQKEFNLRKVTLSLQTSNVLCVAQLLLYIVKGLDK